jgi:phosphatidylethanolamine-binding protein (PEBP) family uncharacterized protein
MRSRGTPVATTVLAVLAAAALSGCGSSATSATATNGLVVKPVIVAVRSSAVHRNTLAALYTCDGRDISPPLSWGAFPSGLQELALFVLGASRGKKRTVVSIEWGLAGIKPGVRSLRAGEIPRGAFTVTNSRNSKHYSICPAPGQSEVYNFVVLALPRGARATPSIAGPALFQNLTGSNPQYESPAYGAVTSTYKRP